MTVFIVKVVDIVSFADDNTLYMWANNNTNLIEDLEDSAHFIFNWFANNKMQGNASKCHVLLSTNEKVITWADIVEIESSHSEKLLGIAIDSQLSFEKILNNICAQRKG